jgi:penicillin-binding protein 2
MSNKRLKIFAIFCTLFAGVCILRLAYIQLNPHSVWQGQLEKIRTGKSTELNPLRGKILDRNGKILATNEACFTLGIDYRFARLADRRFWQVQLLKCSNETEREKVKAKFQQDYSTLNEIIALCAEFKKCTPEQITEMINKQINDPLWELRLYLAGKRKSPNQELEQTSGDANELLLAASEIDIAEMHQFQPLFKLENEDEVLAAQLKFIDIDGVEVQPGSERIYPYKDAASLVIGWVKPWNSTDQQNSDEDDKYSPGDMTGFCGIEYVCEPYLKGRQGKIVYSIDNEVVSRTERVPGGDVKLTIDIDLQNKTEDLLKNPNLNPVFGKAIGIVIIDVNSTDILTMASIPDFDLNTARQDYSKLLKGENQPLLNRVLNSYPPGSSAKPIILSAGLSDKKITPSEVISCPAAPAPTGWPNCMIFRTQNSSHDQLWEYEGGNNARNALRGSCNIYFSRLASRVEPETLQHWLYKFGFGQPALEIKDPAIIDSFRDRPVRKFPQPNGIISSSIPKVGNIPFEDLPPLDPEERKFFGIGQGNFRATPLQVANAFAAIARGGVFKYSRIIATQPADAGYNLNLSQQTLATIYDGMHAVVNEAHGTANAQFAGSGFEGKGIKVYGKTGSTEKPYHAWFAGFAKDSSGKEVVFVVLVEGGQHGGSDAGPLARDVVALCIEQGYLK